MDLIYGVDEGRILSGNSAGTDDRVLDLEYTLGASNVLFLEIK